MLQPQLSTADAFEVARGVDVEDIRQVLLPGGEVLLIRILPFLGVDDTSWLGTEHGLFYVEQWDNGAEIGLEI